MPSLTWPRGWKVSPDGKRVAVEVRTEDFLQALRLFEAVAKVAEEQEHHPDLHLTSYNRVRIETYSHDVGHLTARDERLAKAISRLLEDAGLDPA